LRKEFDNTFVPDWLRAELEEHFPIECLLFFKYSFKTLPEAVFMNNFINLESSQKEVSVYNVYNYKPLTSFNPLLLKGGRGNKICRDDCE
jgi:hypothetical protein